MRLAQTARTVTTRLRAWAAEGQSLVRSGFGLTPREREGALLVAALFVLGLAVQWLRWILS
jgi:hypothetical protein